jgi:hypothetical protein
MWQASETSTLYIKKNWVNKNFQNNVPGFYLLAVQPKSSFADSKLEDVGVRQVEWANGSVDCKMHLVPKDPTTGWSLLADWPVCCGWQVGLARVTCKGWLARHSTGFDCHDKEKSNSKSVKQKQNMTTKEAILPDV